MSARRGTRPRRRFTLLLTAAALLVPPVLAAPVAWSASAPVRANPTAVSAGLLPRLVTGCCGALVTHPATADANPGQPTISRGDTGEAVRRLQRALRRTPNPSLHVDGVFGAGTERAVLAFQSGSGLPSDGVVGPGTWAALPDGGPMPTLTRGATGDAVRQLQRVLTNGAAGQWRVGPGGVDGVFGPGTAASVRAFQRWGGVAADGVVGDQTWAVSLHAASATLESAVGLQFVID
jgi:peptidoglycan hydrolase-like protein with peptidoglycan-binding domain